MGKPGKSTGGEIREASGTAFGIGGRAVADRGAGQRQAGNVARRHHQREPERHLAAGIGQEAGEIKLHGRRFAGHDVAGAEGEDIGPFFLGNGRAAAGGEGAIVILACLGSLLDHSLDDPRADLHPQAADRGPVGQREDIGCLKGLVEGIDEGLADRKLVQQTVDPATDTVKRTHGETPVRGLNGAEARLVVGNAESLRVSQLGKHPCHRRLPSRVNESTSGL